MMCSRAPVDFFKIRDAKNCGRHLAVLGSFDGYCVLLVRRQHLCGFVLSRRGLRAGTEEKQGRNSLGGTENKV